MSKKHDVYIANTPFKLRSINRGSTDDQVARFGSPEKGETNLDLLKAKTQKSFRGGMFQRIWTDDEMASTITNGYYNKLDDALYPTPELIRTVEGTGINARSVTAWCYFNGYLFCAVDMEAPTATNALISIDVFDRTVASVTLPAALSGSTCPITSMVVHRNAIFISGKSIETGTDLQLHRFNGVSTFTALGTGGKSRKLVAFRDKLYGMGTDTFQLITNEFTSSATWTTIKSGVGLNDPYRDTVNDLKVFNSAVYLAKSDGLYRFDGVEITAVFDYAQAREIRAFEYLATFNGRLYYNIGAKLYEFDGVTVTELQDFTEGYKITDIQGGHDRLWIACRLNGSAPGIDKLGTGDLYSYTIFCFNGVGIFEYSEVPDTNQIDYAGGLKVMPAETQLYSILPDVYLNVSAEPRSNGYFLYSNDLALEFTTSSADVTADRVVEIISSEFDGGYSNVDKVLNGIHVDYRGLDVANTHILIEEQHFIDGAWSDLATIWDSTYLTVDGMTNDYYIYEQVKEALETEPVIFEKIRYKLTMTLAPGEISDVPRIRSVTMRYNIMPRLRLKWATTLALYNNIDNGYYSDAKVARKVLYDAYKLKLPILYYDVDYSTVSGYNADTHELQILSDDWLSDGDSIAINTGEGWINRRVNIVEVDGTQVIQLGSFGSREGIGGSELETFEIDEGDEVRKAHVAYIVDIQNERIILDENTIAEDQGSSNLESEVTVELVEV